MSPKQMDILATVQRIKTHTPKYGEFENNVFQSDADFYALHNALSGGFRYDEMVEKVFAVLANCNHHDKGVQAIEIVEALKDVWNLSYEAVL